MSTAASPVSADRAFAFEAADHAAISELVYAEAGILLPPAKAQLVYSRLVRRIRARGLDTFRDYIALLGRDTEERSRAIDTLTTNHTNFFRENHHFEHFMARWWPELAGRLAAGQRVRLWSAACSSGEEPLSLAMAILGADKSAARTLAGQDFQILATDLSADILATASAARYPADAVRSIPDALRTAWFTDQGGMWQARPELRDRIAYRRLNLLKDWPMRQTFDTIFCRNVMIYFDAPTKARLQSRLADQLAVGGFLYIGHSERLEPEVAPRFANIGRTVYRKVKP